MNYNITPKLSLITLLGASFAQAADHEAKPQLSSRDRFNGYVAAVTERPVLNLGVAAALGAAAYAASEKIIARTGHGKWATPLAYIGTQWAAGKLWEQVNRFTMRNQKAVHAEHRTWITIENYAARYTPLSCTITTSECPITRHTVPNFSTKTRERDDLESRCRLQLRCLHESASRVTGTIAASKFLWASYAPTSQ